MKKLFSSIKFTFIILISLSFILASCKLVNNQGQEAASPEIKIIDGNVAQVEPSGETKILVDKKDYESVTEFTAVEVSPDKSKICFLAQTIVPIWLYYSNIDGSGVTKVAVAKNCVWSHDSQKIAFNNHTTDVSPVNVLVYNIASAKQTNLTQKVQQESIIRAYQLPQWSQDDTEITSQFTGLDFNNPSNKIEGTSTINLLTNQITDN